MWLCADAWTGATALEDSLSAHLSWVDEASDELLAMGCAVSHVYHVYHGCCIRHLVFQFQDFN